MKMGFYGHGGMGWIGMIIGLFITIALIVGFVVLVVWAVKRLSGNTSHSVRQSGSSQSARDIAQIRYAKGEISREEYQNILIDLAG